MAKEFSDDFGSAKAGGDIGIITEGMMGEVFEKALSSLREGDVSEVIYTNFGFQIIKLTVKEFDKVQPYEAVKDEVSELLKTNIAAEKFYQMAERFAELSFENPDSLEPIVEELGLSIEKQENVTEGNGEGVASFDKVRHATFSEDVLDGNNSDAIEVGPEHLVVLRINKHTPEDVLPLEAVKAVVELSVKKDKAVQLVGDKAAGILIKLKAGTTFKEIALLGGITLKDVGPVTRNDKSVPEKLLRDAFSMSHPIDGKPSFKQSALNNGDVAIIKLIKITDGDKNDITKTARESFRKFLARLTGEVTLATSLANLSVETDVIFAKQSE